jgi:hypothetical protein
VAGACVAVSLFADNAHCDAATVFLSRFGCVGSCFGYFVAYSLDFGDSVRVLREWRPAVLCYLVKKCTVLG